MHTPCHGLRRPPFRQMASQAAGHACRGFGKQDLPRRFIGCSAHVQGPARASVRVAPHFSSLLRAFGESGVRILLFFYY